MQTVTLLSPAGAAPISSTPIAWKEVAPHVGGRNPSQCRERWTRSLAPDLNFGEWGDEETARFEQLVASHGASWSKVNKLLKTGRPDGALKNQWRKLQGRASSGRGSPTSASEASDSFDEKPVDQIFEELLEGDDSSECTEVNVLGVEVFGALDLPSCEVDAVGMDDDDDDNEPFSSQQEADALVGDAMELVMF